MTPDDVIVLAGRLAAEGEPYVLALSLIHI